MADAIHDELLDNFSSVTLQTQNDVDLKYIFNYVNDKFDSNNYAVYTHNLYFVNDCMYICDRQNNFTGLISINLYLEQIL